MRQTWKDSVEGEPPRFFLFDAARAVWYDDDGSIINVILRKAKC